MRRMATIPELFWNRIDASPEARAVYRYAEGTWQPLSWRAFAEEVVATAERLRRVGLKAGDRIAFYSENRYEWLVIDLAIQLIPAVHVPLHAPLTGAQARYQIDHSGASAVIVSGPELAARLEEAYGELSTSTHWFSLEPIGSAPWEKLETGSSGVDIRAAEELGRSVVDRVASNDLATILYTSGTTGEPKGVMLSQNNLATNALATAAAYPNGDQDGVRLCLLPLSHIFARLCDLYLWLVQGTSLAVARSRETVLEDCQALQPSWFNAVPYFFDKCYRILREQGKAEERGAVRRLFGGKIEYCCCGGAGLPEYLFDYYQSQDVPVLPGYGLTESSPVISVSRPDAVRRGASGKPIEGVEVRVAEDGEILTRGPHVMMGYYHDDEATASVIRDGWLYTGDYGRVDEDGFVYITGRKKEIIVTAGGKNMAPVLLESLLTQDPLIEQALVIGDGRKYLAALLVPNFTLLRQRVESELGPDRVEGMCEDEQVRQWYAEIVERQLASLSKYEQVRRFALLPRPFSIEKGEMTPKLSLRRSVIEEHFRDEIESLYR